MNRLALVGISALAFLAGCPMSHGIVRSCDEASSAPDGTRCEAFATCPTSTSCAGTIECRGGVIARVGPFCDGGSTDAAMDRDAGRDAGVDAAIDAGPCAPRQPTDGRGCHLTGECDPSRFEMCFAPGASRGCGPCVHAVATCATDTDCPSDAYCRAYRDPCAIPNLCGNGPDPVSTACVPRCTATSCGAGESCDAASGACRPLPCVGGAYTCPSHMHCQDTAGGDAHGCARDSCTFDADCGCGGACLSGSCYDTLGTCASPAA